MKLLALLPLAFVLSAGQATAASFSYTDFSSTTGLTLNGDAAKVGSVLRLVPPVETQSGSAFLTSPIEWSGATSFSTSFAFNVTTDSGNPTDGFAFLLQNSAAGAAAIGAAGQGLGYAGVSPSVAVVFRGRGPSLIGVISGGVDPADLTFPFQPAGFYEGTQGEFYNQNQNAWIDYDAASTTLSVYLGTGAAKPASAIMSTTVDIYSTLGSQAFVGFSAGNGGAFGSQDISAWSFTSAVPEPETYAMLLAGLGLMGALAKRRRAQVLA